MKKSLVLLGVVLAIGGALYAAWAYLNDKGRLTTDPQFVDLTVQYADGELCSPDHPRANFRVSSEYEYLGGQKFILYGASDVEQHFFVKASGNGMIQSAFLFQFESVKEGIDWQYDYSGAELRSAIDDFDFFTDAAPHSRHLIFPQGRPGSDFNLEQEFLISKGYSYPENYTWARLAHLPTRDRREELLIVFTQDLEPQGLTRADLEKSGDHADKWPSIAREHLNQLEASLRISVPDADCASAGR